MKSAKDSSSLTENRTSGTGPPQSRLAADPGPPACRVHVARADLERLRAEIVVASRSTCDPTDDLLPVDGHQLNFTVAPSGQRALTQQRLLVVGRQVRIADQPRNPARQPAALSAAIRSPSPPISRPRDDSLQLAAMKGHAAWPRHATPVPHFRSLQRQMRSREPRVKPRCSAPLSPGTHRVSRRHRRPSLAGSTNLKRDGTRITTAHAACVEG
jgi:hypothetical protein